MWVKCHECKGTGFLDIYNVEKDKFNKHFFCQLCNKNSHEVFDNLMSGFIYVRDKKNTITHPSRPREFR